MPSSLPWFLSSSLLLQSVPNRRLCCILCLMKLSDLHVSRRAMSQCMPSVIYGASQRLNETCSFSLTETEDCKVGHSVTTESPERSSEHLLYLAQAVKQLHLLRVKKWELTFHQFRLYRTCSLMYILKYTRTLKPCPRPKYSPSILIGLPQLWKGYGIFTYIQDPNSFLIIATRIIARSAKLDSLSYPCFSLFEFQLNYLMKGRYLILSSIIL